MEKESSGEGQVSEGMSRARGWERCLGKETKILKRKLFLAEGKEIVLFPG